MPFEKGNKLQGSRKGVIVPKLSRSEVKAEITDKSIVINLNRLNAKNN